MPILVVDDDTEIRALVCELLTDEGYTVAQAINGHEALAYLQAAESPPHLILLDMMMPLMNGWDFLYARQRDRVLQAIPVVIVSAVQGFAIAAALGVQESLVKPIDIDHLLAIVQRYCSDAPTP